LTESQPTVAASRRDDLLRIGRELFARHTYDELSIDDVAAAAGVAKGLIYYYFKSKRGFYLAAIQAEADALLALAQPDVDLPPALRLRRTLDAYLAYVGESEERYRGLVISGIGSDPEVRAIRDRERGEFLRLISEGVAEQDEPSPALRSALEGWIAFVEGVSLDWLTQRDLDAETLRELLVAALVGALGAAQSIDPELAIDYAVIDMPAPE
jgi:AcrR family transcriptional regulator